MNINTGYYTGYNTVGSRQDTEHKLLTSYMYNTYDPSESVCLHHSAVLQDETFPWCTAGCRFDLFNHVHADVWHEINRELCVGSGGHKARCFNLACYAANPGGILKAPPSPVFALCCNIV